MLLLREGLCSSPGDDLGAFSNCSRARFRMGRLEAGDGETERELRLDCFVLALVEGSSIDDEGVKARERRPVRGLGVGEGEGRLGAMDIRFSGVRDRGRRFKLEGRCLPGVAFVIASAGVGGAIFSLIELMVDGRGTSAIGNSKESSSSSSSSTRVWSWSLAEEEGPRSLKESRLFPIRELP